MHSTINTVACVCVRVREPLQWTQVAPKLQRLRRTVGNTARLAYNNFLRSILRPILVLKSVLFFS